MNPNIKMNYEHYGIEYDILYTVNSQIRNVYYNNDMKIIPTMSTIPLYEALDLALHKRNKIPHLYIS
jgi:hypothetical protein